MSAFGYVRIVAKLRFLFAFIVNLIKASFGKPARAGWSAKYDALVRTLRGFHARALTLEAGPRRAFLEAIVVPGGGAPEVTTTKVVTGGVAASWVAAKGVPVALSRPSLVYFHGGGFESGSLATYLDLVSRLAAKAKMRVLFLDYRLSPDFPYPAALNDALDAVRFLRENGNKDLVFAGDQAGAHLAVATMLKLKEANEPLPLRAALLSPWPVLDSTGTATHVDADPIPPGAPAVWLSQYRSGRDQPQLSLVEADLRGLPPTLFQIGTAELFHDDAIALAKKANADGVHGKATMYKDMVGGWHLFAPMGIGESLRAIDEVGAFLDEAAPPNSARTSASKMQAATGSSPDIQARPASSPKIEV